MQKSKKTELAEKDKNSLKMARRSINTARQKQQGSCKGNWYAPSAQIRGNIFIILLLLSVALSIAGSIKEADHECSGEDCPVCLVIHVARQNLKLFRIFFASLVLSQVLIFRPLRLQAADKKISYIGKSLISLKIRIND